jgi:REP element-mobilizing transposase RayT
MSLVEFYAASERADNLENFFRFFSKNRQEFLSPTTRKRLQQVLINNCARGKCEIFGKSTTKFLIQQHFIIYFLNFSF